MVVVDDSMDACQRSCYQKRTARFLYDVFVEEQGWQQFPPDNPSGLRVTVDAFGSRELVDDFTERAVWIVEEDTGETTMTATSTQNTGIVGCLRLIHPDLFGGRAESERYIVNEEERLLFDGLKPYVEANRFAVAKEYRTATVTYRLMHMFGKYARDHWPDRAILGINSGDALKYLMTKSGATLIKEDYFEYNKNCGEEACNVFLYKPGPGIDKFLQSTEGSMRLVKSRT